jgi:hypothetical protein
VSQVSYWGCVTESVTGYTYARSSTDEYETTTLHLIAEVSPALAFSYSSEIYEIAVSAGWMLDGLYVPDLFLLAIQYVA